MQTCYHEPCQYVKQEITTCTIQRFKVDFPSSGKLCWLPNPRLWHATMRVENLRKFDGVNICEI